MELLQLCLERFGWKGDVCDWQNKLDQALGRVQSWLTSESDSVLMLITGFQMDCLRGLCHAASAGNEAQTLLSAFALCDAFMPFNHWFEEGFLTGKHDKLTELARRHPKIHVLLGGDQYATADQWAEAVLKSRNEPHDAECVQQFLRYILCKEDLL